MSSNPKRALQAITPRVVTVRPGGEAPYIPYSSVVVPGVPREFSEQCESCAGADEPPSVFRTIYKGRQSFTATCPPTATGTPVTKLGEAESYVSQADADALALAAAQLAAETAIVCTPIPVPELPTLWANPVFDGPIYDMAQDDAGNIYVVGAFTTVNALPRTGIAKLDQHGQLDLLFNAGDAYGLPNRDPAGGEPWHVITEVPNRVIVVDGGASIIAFSVADSHSVAPSGSSGLLKGAAWAADGSGDYTSAVKMDSVTGEKSTEFNLWSARDTSSAALRDIVQVPGTLDIIATTMSEAFRVSAYPGAMADTNPIVAGVNPRAGLTKYGPRGDIDAALIHRASSYFDLALSPFHLMMDPLGARFWQIGGDVTGQKPPAMGYTSGFDPWDPATLTVDLSFEKGTLFGGGHFRGRAFGNGRIWSGKYAESGYSSRFNVNAASHDGIANGIWSAIADSGLYAVSMLGKGFYFAVGDPFHYTDMGGNNTDMWTRAICCTQSGTQRCCFIMNGLRGAFGWDVPYAPDHSPIVIASDGSVDHAYGVQTAHAGGAPFNEKVYCGLFQDTGKLVLGGNFTSYRGNVCGYITRVKTTGAIDTFY